MTPALRIAVTLGAIGSAVGAFVWIRFQQAEHQKEKLALHQRNADRVGRLIDRWSLDSAAKIYDSLIHQPDSTSGLEPRDQAQLEGRLQRTTDALRSCTLHFNQILSGPQDADFLRTLAEASADLDSTADAKPICHATVLLSWIRFHQRTSEIIPEIDRCLARWPDEPGFRMIRGIHLLSQSNPQEAIQWFPESTSFDPNHLPQALELFGMFQARSAAWIELGRSPDTDPTYLASGSEGRGAEGSLCSHKNADYQSRVAGFWAWLGDSTRALQAHHRSRTAWQQEESRCPVECRQNDLASKAGKVINCP